MYIEAATAGNYGMNQPKNESNMQTWKFKAVESLTNPKPFVIFFSRLDPVLSVEFM